MKLLIWYNLNHHSFKTEYKQLFTPHKVGEINKFNHQLIQVIEFDLKKPKLSEKTADRLELLANRLRYGKKAKNHVVTDYKYPWWYRK